MKILFFASYYLPYISGITTYPAKLLAALVKKDHKATVLTFRHDQNLKEEEIIDGVVVKRMPFLFRISKGFISIRSLIYFFRELKQTDVVFLNIPNGEGLALALLARIMNKKVIAIFHCQVDLGRSLIQKFVSLFLNMIVYCQLKLSNKVVIYTKDYFNSLEMSTFLKDRIVEILPPVEKLPVDKETLGQMKKKKGKEKWIGFAGRIAKEKGLLNLVKAISNLNDDEVTVVFAGPYGKDVVGEERYYMKLLSLLKEKNIKYHFFGLLGNGKLGAFYEAIDLLVLPSINKTEAFGMVQIEAMLHGKPVISSNLPGVRVPVQLSNMGKVTKLNDVADLSKCLREVLQDLDKLSTSKKIKQLFKKMSLESVISRYQQLI